MRYTHDLNEFHPPCSKQTMTAEYADKYILCTKRWLHWSFYIWLVLSFFAHHHFLLWECKVNHTICINIWSISYSKPHWSANIYHIHSHTQGNQLFSLLSLILVVSRSCRFSIWLILINTWVVVHRSNIPRFTINSLFRLLTERNFGMGFFF